MKRFALALIVGVATLAVAETASAQYVVVPSRPVVYAPAYPSYPVYGYGGGHYHTSPYGYSHYHGSYGHGYSYGGPVYSRPSYGYSPGYGSPYRGGYSPGYGRSGFSFGFTIR